MSTNVLGQYTMKEANNDFKNGIYHEALKKYLKIYENEPEDIELNYNIGICYLTTNKNKAAAIPFLEFAANQDVNNNYVYFDLAHAYHYVHKFEDAIEMYEKFLQVESKNTELIEQANRNISQCRMGNNYIQNPLNVTLVNLDDRINSEKSEYLPFISEDGDKLFFTSDEKYMGSYGAYINNIQGTELSGNNWKRPRSVGSKVNTMEDEILAGYSSRNDILIARLYRWEIFEDIMLFEMKKTSARNMLDPGENINSSEHESGACLSITGDTLFFASNRPDGYGGFDIYMSKKLPNGLWGIPTNLGPTINSGFNEDFPNLSNDGKTLYFASDNFESIGGYDVFFSRLGRNGEWMRPRNMGYPINDAYDNYNISITSNGRHGYVSLNREDGFGEYDIYQVIFNEKDPTISIRKGQVFALNTDTIPISTIDTTLIFKVLNAQNNSTVGEYAVGKKNSDYVIALPPGKYTLKLNKEGFKAYEESFFIQDKHINQNKISTKNIYLRKEE